MTVFYPLHPFHGGGELPVVRRYGNGRVEQVEVETACRRQILPHWMFNQDRCLIRKFVHQAILLEARQAAREVIAADPGLAAPDHALLRRSVLVRYGKTLELGDVG